MCDAGEVSAPLAILLTARDRAFDQARKSGARERPQVVRIRTGNADSNVAMLKINFEMGLKPYTSHAIYQVETGKAEAYVRGR